MKTQLMICIALLVAIAAAATGAATVAQEFSEQRNPSIDGRWAYGWKRQLNGDFQAFTRAFAVSWWNASVTGWSMSGEGPQHGSHCCPYVGRNRSGRQILGTGARVGKDDVWFHPGASGEFAVVRFTCHSPGRQKVVAKFYGAGDGQTDVHVSKNNTEIWSGAIGGMGQIREYQNAGVECYASDVIDFAVGFGADRVYYGDITGLAVTVEPITEGAMDPRRQ